jgi:phage tail-like protein
MSKILDRVKPFPHSIYRSIIKPIRDADAETEFLKRFLQGPQAAWEDIYTAIGSLAKIQDPDETQANALPLLKKLVGFTGPFDTLTADFTEDQLRKLLLLAIPIWKEKGSEKGLLSAIRLLVAVNPLLFNWFFHNLIIDEAVIGEEWGGTDLWILNNEEGNVEPFESRIMVFDDGTLDRDLLLNVINLFRIPSERIDVTYHPFLEDFDLDFGQWNVQGNTPGLIVNEGIGEIRPTSAPWLLDSSPVTSSLAGYSTRVKLKRIETPASPSTRTIIGARFQDLGGGSWSGFGIEINFVQETIQFGTISFTSPTTLTFTPLATFNDWHFAEDTFYTFTLEVEDDGTDIVVQFFADRDQVFRETLVGGDATYPNGSVLIAGRNMDLDIDFVHITPIPVDADRVEP